MSGLTREKLNAWHERSLSQDLTPIANIPFEPKNPSINKLSLNNINLNQEFKLSLNQVLNKRDFHRIASQLTQWNISNSGAVIKRENPILVKKAVEITIANLDKAKCPKAYFRGVLRNLQKAV